MTARRDLRSRAVRRLSGLGPAAVLLIGLAVVCAGPLAGPVAAAAPTDVTHALGWIPTPGRGQGISTAAAGMTADLGSYPSSVDLSAWVAPVGNQGQVGSCASWATGYYYRYWLRNHAYGETSTYAPMYLYAQIAQGNWAAGSTFPDNFGIMEAQGIDRSADYPQGDYDYTTQPTAAEVAAAAAYKITSYRWVFFGANAGNQAAIEATLAAGQPMVIGIPVYDNFMWAGPSSSLIGVPTADMSYWGGHALFAAKYDASGVWVENSWGTGWGSHGWGELSWAFVDQYASEGWTMAADPARAPGTASHLTVAIAANPFPAGGNRSVTVKAGLAPFSWTPKIAAASAERSPAWGGSTSTTARSSGPRPSVWPRRRASLSARSRWTSASRTRAFAGGSPRPASVRRGLRSQPTSEPSWPSSAGG